MAQAIEELQPEATNPAELIAAWVEWMEVFRNLSLNTRRLYGRNVEVFAQDYDLLTATEEDIQAWITSRGGKSGTVSNRISALTCFYRWAKKSKLRIDNPAAELDRPKSDKGLPKPITDVERALRKLDAEDLKANEKLKHNPRLQRRVGETRDMAVFLIETGLRIHEAVALNVSIPCGDTLRLRGKGGKDAIIPLTEAAREALNSLRGQWGHGVNGKPIGARATQRRFEKAGIHPHMCRHTRGTSMAEAGCDLGDIQAMLRHASPATTLVYSAWSTDRVRAALGKVG